MLKYYAEKYDSAFRNEAYEIAKYFDNANDYQLAEYIMALLSERNIFMPQVEDGPVKYIVILLQLL